MEERIVMVNKRTSKIDNFKGFSQKGFSKIFFGKRYLFIISDIEQNNVTVDVFSYDIISNAHVETYHGSAIVPLGETISETIIEVLRAVGEFKTNRCLKKAV